MDEAVAGWQFGVFSFLYGFLPFFFVGLLYRLEEVWSRGLGFRLFRGPPFIATEVGEAVLLCGLERLG